MLNPPAIPDACKGRYKCAIIASLVPGISLLEQEEVQEQDKSRYGVDCQVEMQRYSDKIVRWLYRQCWIQAVRCLSP